MDMFNDSNLIVPEYCDNCGHLVSRYHLKWKDENNNTYYSKCFGADTDWYYRTFGDMDFSAMDEASFAQMIEKDVACKCTKVP